MINLLPPEAKDAIRYARWNVLLIRYCILVLAICAAILAIVFTGRAFIGRTEKQMYDAIAADREKASQLAAVNTKAKELSTKIDTIGTILDREIKFTNLLKELGSLMPDGAVLTNLSLSNETLSKPLGMDVFVANERTAAVLRENLVNSDLFTSADIQNLTSREDDPRYRFTANFQVFFNNKERAAGATTEDKAE